MDLNKLTEKAQEAIAAAQRQAESRRNTQLEPEHLLLALVQQENGVVPAVLEKLGVAPRQAADRERPGASGQSEPTPGPVAAGHQPLLL